MWICTGGSYQSEKGCHNISQLRPLASSENKPNPQVVELIKRTFETLDQGARGIETGFNSMIKQELGIPDEGIGLLMYEMTNIPSHKTNQEIEYLRCFSTFSAFFTIRGLYHYPLDPLAEPITTEDHRERLAIRDLDSALLFVYEPLNFKKVERVKKVLFGLIDRRTPEYVLEPVMADEWIVGAPHEKIIVIYLYIEAPQVQDKTGRPLFLGLAIGLPISKYNSIARIIYKTPNLMLGYLKSRYPKWYRIYVEENSRTKPEKVIPMYPSAGFSTYERTEKMLPRILSRGRAPLARPSPITELADQTIASNI